MKVLNKRYIVQDVLFFVSKIVLHLRLSGTWFGKMIFSQMHSSVLRPLLQYEPTVLQDDWQLGSESSNVNQNVCWAFWASGYKKAPTIVKLCLNSLVKNMPGSKIIILDMNSVRKYASIPEFIYEKMDRGEISLTHFSDILRMALLSQNGGYWVDSTILLKKNPRFAFQTQSFFSIRQEKANGFNISHGRWTGFLIGGSSFRPVAAYAFQFFINYWKSNDKLIGYFLIDYVLDIAYAHNVHQFRELCNSLKPSNKHINLLMPALRRNVDYQTIIETVVPGTDFFKLSYKKSVSDSCYSTIKSIYE